MAERIWQLISSKLSDGAECLALKMPSGFVLCQYAPGRKPHENLWHSYFLGFPKQEFNSREACIRNAEKFAGHELVVREKAGA